MYKYPENLINFLTEQESEGSEIFTTSTEDSTMFIIKPENLDKWVVLIEWFEGSEEYSTVNIYGKAFDRLKRVMKECEEIK